MGRAFLWLLVGSSSETHNLACFDFHPLNLLLFSGLQIQILLG
jgi:hypothetical protein